jgi:5'-phosphate synthase pdxT subunit
VKVGVLALQGDVREHADALECLGSDPVEVRAGGDLDAVDALVLPGGESTTVSMLLGSCGLLEPLRERLSDGLPVLGTCAGMILLASEVVGGGPGQLCLGALDITVQRNAFGRQLDSFEQDLDVRGVAGGPFRAVFIRAPIVERCGPGVEILAELGPPARGPVLCRQGSVLAAAFHPELSGDLRLHQLFLSVAGEEVANK